VTTICIAVGIRMYREGLAEHLADIDRFDVVASASDWTGCVEAVERTRPDVVVLDVTLPPSLADAGELTRVAPELGILALVVASPTQARACLNCGMAGYVTPDDSLAVVEDRIDRAARGEVTGRRMVGDRSEAPEEELALTPQERRVVGLIVHENMTNAQIGAKLHIQEATVKNHAHSVFTKVGVSGRSELRERLRGERRGAPI
jgi:DNA-binding NarL/FixJ family response regulator